VTGNQLFIDLLHEIEMYPKYRHCTINKKERKRRNRRREIAKLSRRKNRK
jgi:hypothetical protein